HAEHDDEDDDRGNSLAVLETRHLAADGSPEHTRPPPSWFVEELPGHGAGIVHLPERGSARRPRLYSRPIMTEGTSIDTDYTSLYRARHERCGDLPAAIRCRRGQP